ncbi:MAG: P22 coat - protein 5 family protein [Alphaproteobacteria bacterium]|nr:P22 coat - protein 5 family protein [Alphaproteobacteria bacterium]
MGNVLTNMIPALYQALDVVSRELVGFIPSVARDSSAERAALNEDIIVPISVPHSLVDVAPAMAVPEPSDFTVDNTVIKITNSKSYSFGLNGEEYRGLDNGVGASKILQGNIEQGLRTLCNQIEADIALEAGNNAGHVYGTAGTAPFGSNLGDAAEIRKLLDDAGTPAGERSLVINTSAGVNLRKLTQLTNVDNAGTSMTLRQGELLDLFGMSLKESAGIKEFAAGNATGLTVAAATAGATKLKASAVTSGALKVGDVITIAGDSTKYMVTEIPASLAANAEFGIAPALQKDAAANAAVTVAANSVRNVAFTRGAIQLVTRAPALPGGKDAAIDNYMLTDPRSGLSFEVRVYEGYRKMRMELACAWGVKTIKPEHVAALLG